jgi:hypothetical protein
MGGGMREGRCVIERKIGKCKDQNSYIDLMRTYKPVRYPVFHPDPHGYALNLPPGSGSASGVRIRIRIQLLAK